MQQRRVVVTGLGAWTALGASTAAFDAGLRAGTSGVRQQVELFDTSGFRTTLAAVAPEPPVTDGYARLATRPLSRADLFGLHATQEAVGSAGLSPSLLREAAIVFGTGTGGAAITEEYTRAVLAGGAPPPALLVPHQPSSVTDVVARCFDIRGPRTTIMTACSSSATAIGYAADRIRLGHADVAVTGGADALCRLTYIGFNCLRAASTEHCRPFDAARKGLNLGEGAGVLILEEYEHARARGAPILGLLLGWGMSADAYHMTAPHPEGDGARRAMQAALDDARLGPEAIDYVNAHGTGTPHNDAAESAALKALLQARAPEVPVSSTKSMVGHTLGAAGAIEAVASLLALQGGYLPPTIALETPDPAFGLDFIPGAARAQQANVILSNSFAFGGNNTALVFGRA
jgi:3-oxoacyl-[acyl-carrier-protein] synthase II